VECAYATCPAASISSDEEGLSRHVVAYSPSVPHPSMTTDLDNPGSSLKRFRLAAPVSSCAEAAKAKGVDLEHELKSLLVTTDQGLVLAHTRGNRRLSLRAIKHTLGTDQARLAALSELGNIGLNRGTVCPFTPVLWTMRQVVAREVLGMAWVTTNAGEPDLYVVFDPLLLLRAPAISAGDFER
jgi:prolyl-tRNA editing enzyme YbaK/EbsC (Cys-tRNA(Pro) deacylase)